MSVFPVPCKANTGLAIRGVSQPSSLSLCQGVVHLLMQESLECMARDMIDSLVPPMAERIVAQRLRESVKEQGGLIHKDMLSLRADIALLRQGVPNILWVPSLWPAQSSTICLVLCFVHNAVVSVHNLFAWHVPLNTWHGPQHPQIVSCTVSFACSSSRHGCM